MIGTSVCVVHIDPTHFTEAEKFNPPLSYLFEEDNLNSDSAALIYKLHTSENIQWV